MKKLFIIIPAILILGAMAYFGFKLYQNKLVINNLTNQTINTDQFANSKDINTSTTTNTKNQATTTSQSQPTSGNIYFAPQNYYIQEGDSDASTNGEVSKLQNFLTEKGFYQGSVTGSFDEATKQAVINYQQSVGLTAEGFVGNMTRSMMNGEIGRDESTTKIINSIEEVICTLSGNDIDDSSYQNNFLYVTQGKSCATMSGFVPGYGSDKTKESVTFNGITKTWKSVYLSFTSAAFSSDGKHFAYTASNIPVTYHPFGTKWNFQQSIVSDNITIGKTYDNVYYPQYSPDGKHLGYCATEDNEYLKVIDGIESLITKDYYYNDCKHLFVSRQNDVAKTEYTSPDGEITITYSGCGRTSCSPIIVTYNQTGISKSYRGGGERAGSAGDFVFSSDSKHFA